MKIKLTSFSLLFAIPMMANNFNTVINKAIFDEVQLYMDDRAPTPCLDSYYFCGIESTNGGVESLKKEEYQTKNQHGGNEMFVYTVEFTYAPVRDCWFIRNGVEEPTLREVASETIVKLGQVVGWIRKYDAKGYEKCVCNAKARGKDQYSKTNKDYFDFLYVK